MMKTVIFDMDGVLFDTERVYDEAWEFVLGGKGATDIAGIVAQCRGFNEADIEIILDEIFKGIATGKECVEELLEKYTEIIA